MVELFFDLVFVFAVTQITVWTAQDLTWGGVARSLLLFWLIWWAWTQFTWTLNPADTTHAAVRVVTLAATGGAIADVALIGNVVGALKVGIVGHRSSIDKIGVVKALTALLK